MSRSSDRVDAGEEVALDDLREPMQRQPEPVAQPKSDRLPLHDITPDNFEKLVVRLANARPGVKLRARRYGKSGSTQSGIDVQCLDPDSGRWACYEAKRVAGIRDGTLSDWVSRFLGGKHASTASSFHLCTTYAVSDETALLDEWAQCEKQLLALRIHPHLWDRAALDDMLRDHWRIVAELYGETVANGFCVPPAPSLPDPQGSAFAVREEARHEQSVSLYNRSIACSIHLPGAMDRNLSAAVSFARADVSGISMALSARELIEWSQWRVHADASMDRPYAVAHAIRKGAFLLMGGRVRLTLEAAEVADLDWILERAWYQIHGACLKQVSTWRSLDFEPIEHHPTAIGLLSVRPWFWQRMLDFARAHDIEQGNGAWHMFDTAPACLKMYSRSDGERFDRGYHAILYAYSEGTMWMGQPGNVVVGWSPANPATPCSARGQWDARYTHDWLLDQMIPEVVRWLERSEAARTPTRWWTWPSRRAQFALPPIGELVWSRARDGMTTAVPAASIEALFAYVGLLQSHATCQQSDVPLGSGCMRNVLECIDCVLPFASLPTESYLRGSLGLQGTGDLSQSIRRKAGSLASAVHYPAMDFALRGLMEVLRYAPDLPTSDRGHIVQLLAPLQVRRDEDILCRRFSR
ncbi:hypothetical protein KQ945_11855 [Bacillus subtilis subsp. subtilis]|nr:hypothetical protein [Bacillus subtilis subsp. subtilis]